MRIFQRLLPWKFQPCLTLAFCQYIILRGKKFCLHVYLVSVWSVENTKTEFINPFKLNVISHCYQLDESISNFWVDDWYFSFLFIFQLKLLFANSGEPDQTPHFAAFDLVLHCLPMSHKKEARLIWVNMYEQAFQQHL